MVNYDEMVTKEHALLNRIQVALRLGTSRNLLKCSGSNRRGGESGSRREKQEAEVHCNPASNSHCWCAGRLSPILPFDLFLFGSPVYSTFYVQGDQRTYSYAVGISSVSYGKRI